MLHWFIYEVAHFSNGIGWALLCSLINSLMRVWLILIVIYGGLQSQWTICCGVCPLTISSLSSNSNIDIGLSLGECWRSSGKKVNLLRQTHLILSRDFPRRGPYLLSLCSHSHLCLQPEGSNLHTNVYAERFLKRWTQTEVTHINLKLGFQISWQSASTVNWQLNFHLSSIPSSGKYWKDR
jgi:hypothetical protein